MGFEAEYFVSRFWSRASSIAWDRQLALRLGLVLEHVRPSVIVFEGNWPYRGLFAAAEAYGGARLVWSNLLLFKKRTRRVPVPERLFDLVIRLGELGTQCSIDERDPTVRRVTVPPATILPTAELLDRGSARRALGLDPNDNYVLFSLGPGNLKDIGGIGRGLIREFRERGHSIVWAKAPISARDVDLPPGVKSIAEYPLVRYLKAFDVFVGAAGYNTCNEIVQANVPALLVPNLRVADDQARRAAYVSEHALAVVSPCETDSQRYEAVSRVLAMRTDATTIDVCDLSGADRAVEEILKLTC